MSENIISNQFNKTDSSNCGIVDVVRISPLWSQLPAPALELIYSYLSLKDRYNMSLVCRRWYKEFKSPCVWRHFEINFHTKGMWEKYFSGDQFIHKFVQCFRHVRIVGDWDLSQLKLFLKIITPRCQLFSIHFEDMGLFGAFEDDVDVNYLQCILSFFKSQRHLKEITFDKCYFYRKTGYLIFAAIAEHSKSLKNIKLFDIVHDIERNSEFAAETKQVFRFFMSLTEIEMDGEMFQNLITAWLESATTLFPVKAKSLKSIKLYFRYNHKFIKMSNPDILGKALRSFRKQLPELKFSVSVIDLDVETLLVISVLLKNMGMRSLQIKHCSQFYDIRSIIKSFLFPENNFYLEILEIRRIKITNNVVQDLISLLQTCLNLRELILESENLIFGIDTVFEYLLKNYTGSFKTLCLDFRGEKSLEDINMCCKMKEYVYKMREIGINLNIDC